MKSSNGFLNFLDIFSPEEGLTIVLLASGMFCFASQSLDIHELPRNGYLEM